MQLSHTHHHSTWLSLSYTIGFSDSERSGCFPIYFFAGRRRHKIWPRDWSSDVCSSDLRWGSRPVWVEIVPSYTPPWSGFWMHSQVGIPLTVRWKRGGPEIEMVGLSWQQRWVADRDLRSEERRVGKACARRAREAATERE